MYIGYCHAVIGIAGSIPARDLKLHFTQLFLVRSRLAPSLSRMGFDRVYPVYYEIKTHSRETWGQV